MRNIALSVILVCLAMTFASAQCPNRLVYNATKHGNLKSVMTLNIVTDFCAKGNGVTNDDSAFDAASTFIKARGGYCKLIIPSGTYIVGKQARTKSRYLSTNDVLILENVKQVEIAGQGDPRLKYEGGGKLKYGYFNSNGSRRMLNSEQPSQGRSKESDAADLGCMIRVLLSTDVKISGLTLDGNLRPGQIVIGGHDAGNFNGIQEDFSGIGVWYSDNVTISNVKAERMGLDGFYIYNTRDDNSKYNHKKVLIQNCISDFNGRQGMSIIGGENITVSNSSFTNVGMGEIQFSGLQAGVDIEPEAPDHSVKNVTFNNCTFSNCRNAGITITAGSGPVSEVYFNNCTVDNLNETGNNVAISLGRHKKIKFTDCKIYGYVTIDANKAKSYDEGYTFTRCLFSDCSYKPASKTARASVRMRKKMALTSTVLIYTFSSWDYVKMDGCTFDVYTKRPWYTPNTTPGAPSIISNSVINVNGQTDIDFPKSTQQDNVLQDQGLTLTNNKFYMHSGQKYVHNGTVISGAQQQNASAAWNGNTFNRWTAKSPANKCAESLQAK